MAKWLYTAVLLLALLPGKGHASGYVYDYDENCSRAYREYMSLHTDEARRIMISEMKADPYNLMATYIADYDDFVSLLLNSSKQDYKQRAGHLDARLELLEKGDPSSPWFRFCRSGVYLHWAIVDLHFGDQLKAANNFRKSFALLKENQRLFPSFEYNNIFSGLQEAVVGSLPGNYKWIASLFGLKGNLRGGVGKLAAFVNIHTDQQPLYAETALYYVFTRFYLLHEQKEAWAFINSTRFPMAGNLFNTLTKVNIALDYNKSDEAIEALQAAAKDPYYESYPMLDRQMGIALLTKLDTTCISYFKKYLRNNKENIFIKDTWQKIAFASYISNNTSQAAWCLTQVTTLGDTHADADKQAERFAESKVWPMTKILQARLLIDGGYYARALPLLQSIPAAQLVQPTDKLEYLFRLGKAHQEAGDNNKALENYQAAINAGKERHEQFAARAALQMGLIYEHSSMKEQAIARYNECLDMPAHDFQNAIDQQAKAGIARLKDQ